MSAKENEEINKTVKELNKLSKDPDEIAKYEEREWSIMRYNVEMETNREIGEKEGEARGVKIGEERGEKRGRKDREIEIVKKTTFFRYTNWKNCRDCGIKHWRSKKNNKIIIKMKLVRLVWLILFYTFESFIKFS